MNRAVSSKWDTVLFDLDGTLIDQFSAIHECYTYAFKTLGLPLLDFQTVKEAVGGSMPITMRKLVGEENAKKAIPLFEEHFDKVMLDTSKVEILPGGMELIESLASKGIQLAIFTNKHGEKSRAICDCLGITPWVQCIVGSEDTDWLKPDKELSQYMMDRLSADPERTTMIGDSPFDLQAATVIGMRPLMLTTGSHDRNALSQEGAELIYDSMEELIELF